MIMKDGSVSRHGLLLCTNSYSVQDVVQLINVLIIRYRLECNLRLQKQNNQIGYRIYIQQSSMASLLNIVSPYMHSSMLYKLKSALSSPSNCKKIEVTDIKNNTTTSYNSISAAAISLNINRSRISEYFSKNQQKPYKGQYTFKKSKLIIDYVSLSKLVI